MMSIKIRNIFLILVYFLTSIIFGQKKTHTVSIEVLAHNLNPSEQIYIAGNNQQLGNWNPAAVKLDNIQNKLWQKKFTFPEGTDIQFKFTKGSWSNEALTNERKIPNDYYLTVERDTTIQFEIKCWKEESFIQNEFKLQITGTVNYHKNLQWPGLKPRDIIVWLPPGYETNLNDRYPVLYMHDGQNIVDPKTSTFGIDWQIDEAADSLIRLNKIEPIIIVGIYNTKDRSSEYLNIDSGYVYMDFVINKVKKLVDENYRTKTDRENTATGGSSLAGLISLMLAWEHPEIFSKAYCISPAVKVSNIDYVSEVEKYIGDKKEIKLYFYVGGIGLEARLEPGINEMITTLLSKGFILNEDLFFVKNNKFKHNESDWAKIIPNALQVFYSN